MQTISMCTACSVLPCICHSICTVSHACIVCIYISQHVNGATVKDLLPAAQLYDAQDSDNSRRKLIVILDVVVPRTFGESVPRQANEAEAGFHHRIKTSWGAMGPDARKSFILDQRIIGQLEYGAWGLRDSRCARLKLR